MPCHIQIKGLVVTLDFLSPFYCLPILVSSSDLNDYRSAHLLRRYLRVHHPYSIENLLQSPSIDSETNTLIRPLQTGSSL